MNNDINTNTPLFEKLRETTSKSQSEAFKKNMHWKIESRLLDHEQKKVSWLSYYMSKFRYAIPVAAIAILALGVLFIPQKQDMFVHAPSNITAQTDPEMNEIIQLAFAFETESDPIVKTASVIESDMILAYLRE